jgi:hypothetical protein
MMENRTAVPELTSSPHPGKCGPFWDFQTALQQMNVHCSFDQIRCSGKAKKKGKEAQKKKGLFPSQSSVSQPF